MNSLLDKTPVFSYDYTVNGIGQRIERVVSGQSFDRALNPERQNRADIHRYGYDARGQVVYQQALVSQEDGSLKNRRVEGRIYQFDGIGNRIPMRAVSSTCCAVAFCPIAYAIELTNAPFCSTVFEASIFLRN